MLASGVYVHAFDVLRYLDAIQDMYEHVVTQRPGLQVSYTHVRTNSFSVNLDVYLQLNYTQFSVTVMCFDDAVINAFCFQAKFINYSTTVVRRIIKIFCHIRIFK